MHGRSSWERVSSAAFAATGQVAPERDALGPEIPAANSLKAFLNGWLYDDRSNLTLVLRGRMHVLTRRTPCSMPRPLPLQGWTLAIATPGFSWHCRSAAARLID